MPLSEARFPAADESVPTLSSTLVKQLRLSILKGELAPGSRLRLEALRQQLGVTQSRGPLREALSRLGAEGLVLIEDQRGYRVTPISEENLREIARLRVHMETLALREAIQHGGSVWETDIHHARQKLADVRRRDGMSLAELEGWEAAHRDFHFTLLHACKMPLLLSYCSALHDQNDRYRRIYLSENPFDRDVKREHDAIVEATLERNSDLACALLAQHIERTTRNISRALGKTHSALG